MPRPSLLWIGLASLLVGCGSTSSTSVAACEAGTIDVCKTPSGCLGERTCMPDGKYTECQCDGSDGGAGTGGSGGTASGGAAGAASGGMAGTSGGAGGAGGVGLTDRCTLDFESCETDLCTARFSSGACEPAPTTCATGNALRFTAVTTTISFAPPHNVHRVQANFFHEGTAPATMILYEAGTGEQLTSRTSEVCPAATTSVTTASSVSSLEISVPAGTTAYIDDLELTP